jgi:hypothetical protein
VPAAGTDAVTIVLPIDAIRVAITYLKTGEVDVQ